MTSSGAPIDHKNWHHNNSHSFQCLLFIPLEWLSDSFCLEGSRRVLFITWQLPRDSQSGKSLWTRNTISSRHRLRVHAVIQYHDVFVVLNLSNLFKIVEMLVILDAITIVWHSCYVIDIVHRTPTRAEGVGVVVMVLWWCFFILFYFFIFLFFFGGGGGVGSSRGK